MNSNRPFHRVRRVLVLSFAVFLGTYFIAEFAANIYFYFYPTTLYLVERGDEPVCLFDRTYGYRMSNKPHRYTIIDQKSELVALVDMKGNAQGFPDRTDFSPRRTNPHEKRLLVMGDSFTAGSGIDPNWTEGAEQLLQDQIKSPVQLLNCSLSGIGLGNWHRTLLHLLNDEKYDIDGVVFAVLPDDLTRPFVVMDARNGSHICVGGTNSWAARDYPRTYSQISLWMIPFPMQLLSTTQFNNSLEKRVAPWHLPLWDMFRMVSGVSIYAATAPEEKKNAAAREIVIQEIASCLKQHQIPSLVLVIPPKVEPTGAGDDLVGIEKHVIPTEAKDVRTFAEKLTADFWDGTEFLKGLTRAGASKLYFQCDPHWNQEGSDRYAIFAAHRIREFLDKTSPPTTAAGPP